MQDLVIRPFENFEDFEQAEQLQNVTWSAVETVPSNMLIAMTHHGAIGLGAFEGESGAGRMVGFAFSFLAPTNLLGAQHGLSHHSHMAAVLPELRGQGIGLQLKHAQAQAVLAQGYNLMTWTYDPLEAKNANLNITKLGCICRSYIPNCYGEMRDGLNAGLPSDRFEVEWWLDRKIRIENGELRKIEIPSDFQAIKKVDMTAAKAIRLKTREYFVQAFAAGFVVTGFEMTPTHGIYALTLSGSA